MNGRKKPDNEPSYVVPLVVAAIAFVVGIGLLLFLVFGGETLVRLGLTGNVWFVLLLVLGLAAAIVVFSLFKSYARYKGKVFGGVVELGGPVVVMLVVVLLGFFLVKEPTLQFDLTAFVHGPKGQQDMVLRNDGQVWLQVGSDKRSERIGDKGEARFVGIPANLRGLKTKLWVEADKYETEGDVEIVLDAKAFHVPVKVKLLPLNGTVVDAESKKPLVGAKVVVDGREAITSPGGSFEISLPATSGRRGTISKDGYETVRLELSNGGTVSIPPEKPPPKK